MIICLILLLIAYFCSRRGSYKNASGLRIAAVVWIMVLAMGAAMTPDGVGHLNVWVFVDVGAIIALAGFGEWHQNRLIKTPPDLLAIPKPPIDHPFAKRALEVFIALLSLVLIWAIIRHNAS